MREGAGSVLSFGSLLFLPLSSPFSSSRFLILLVSAFYSFLSHSNLVATLGCYSKRIEDDIQHISKTKSESNFKSEFKSEPEGSGNFAKINSIPILSPFSCNLF